LEAPRIAGVDRRRRLEDSEGPVGELEKRYEGVLCFDVMQRRGHAGLHVRRISKQPDQQIDCVYSLVDECAAAVKRQSAAPTRLRIIFWGTIPLHPGIGQDWPPEHPGVDQPLQAAKTRLETILEKHSQLDTRFLRFPNQAVGALRRDVDWF